MELQALWAPGEVFRARAAGHFLIPGTKTGPAFFQVLKWLIASDSAFLITIFSAPGAFVFPGFTHRSPLTQAEPLHLKS